MSERKLVANLGDTDPIDYGGYFVFDDGTAEYLDVPDYDGGTYFVYRFSLDQCTFENGILSDNPYHKNHPAWFATPTYLSGVASSMSTTEKELVHLFCSGNLIDRAQAYRMIGDYHGFDNLDSYPLELTRREAIHRYGIYPNVR